MILLLHTHLLNNTSHCVCLHHHCYVSFSPFTPGIIHCIIITSYLTLSLPPHFTDTWNGHCIFLHLLFRILDLPSLSEGPYVPRSDIDAATYLTFLSSFLLWLIPRGVSSRNTPHRISEWGNSLPPDWFVSRRRCRICFCKEAIQECKNMLSVSICLLHRSTAAVETTLVKLVAARSWTVSSIFGPVLQVATDVAASGIRGIFIAFLFCMHLSSSGSYPFDLSG